MNFLPVFPEPELGRCSVPEDRVVLSSREAVTWLP